MRRSCFILVFLFLSVTLWSQDYTVVAYDGTVEVSGRDGSRHKVQPKENLYRHDILYVSKGGSVTLNKTGTDRYIAVSETSGEVLGSLLKVRKKTFWKRISSVMKGVGDSGSLNAAVKGDEDTVNALLYAASHPDFSSSYHIHFDLLRNGAPYEGTGFSDGDRVSFYVVNEESFPLFVSILWVDSSGEIVDCLAQRGAFLLLPPEYSLDLSDWWMEVGPPYGIDRICLFASQDVFDAGELIKAIKKAEKPSANGIPVGFYSISVKVGQ